MTVGIMQPYFFPYLGYYALIKHTDRWVVFDTPQFIRHGWIERNRILKQQGGWVYVQVPLVKHSRETRIDQIEIRSGEPWREKILAQLTHYKKYGRFYNDAMDVVSTALGITTSSMVDLNTHILKTTCSYLRIPFDYSIFSQSNLPIDEVSAPDEWALKIALALGAKTYINPPGGVDFFDRSKYERRNIELKFLKIDLQSYWQPGENFEPGLSIIDVMMFNSPERIREFLDRVTFIES